MISRNLRHLRLLLAVAESGSLTAAAARVHVSQPAVTQAIGKLESDAGGKLFERTGQGFFATRRGTALCNRVRRAFDRLDPALADISPRLTLTATVAQLDALVAVQDTENFTLAARRLGVSQPTVHRAISKLEQEAGRRLFERTAFGMTASRATQALAMAVMLAFQELGQAEADIAELNGGDAGTIVIGALPLSRSVLLPNALVRFREERPRQKVLVIDGRYDDLLGGLRRGDIDVIVGALREPAPIEDVVQESLFDDRLVILAGHHHPLVGQAHVPQDILRTYPWVVPREGTPTRDQFNAFFGAQGPPQSIIQAGSILLVRKILSASDHLACISRAQGQAEISQGLVSEVAVDTDWPGRPIGLTTRSNWAPTKAQRRLLTLLREGAESHAV
ncbi:MAG: LysR family transcriptional regulator [Pseudomonadota bacterium]